MSSHDIGPGQREQVVGTAQVARMVGEALAPEIGLGQLVRLEHRAHGAVEHEDALAQDPGQALIPRTPTLVRVETATGSLVRSRDHDDALLSSGPACRTRRGAPAPASYGTRASFPDGRGPVEKVCTNQTILLDSLRGGAVVTGEPLYSLVASRAEQLIASGIWQEGERLPPERQLCRDFDVSRSTLRQALGELEERGLISRHQGRGTFVTRPRLQLPLAGVFSIRDAMRQHGMSLTTRVIGVEVIEASRQLASDLALPAR